METMGRVSGVRVFSVCQDLCIFRLPGKSDAVEYSSLGRLEPWNAQDSARM